MINSVWTHLNTFRCSFCRDSCWFNMFDNCLNVYYLNWLVQCNNLTQKMHTFRNKIAFLKVKIKFKLVWKDELITEYEEYHKLQLCTVFRYQHNNTLGKISSNYRYRKPPKNIEISFFSISHTPTPTKEIKSEKKWTLTWTQPSVCVWYTRVSRRQNN